VVLPGKKWVVELENPVDEEEFNQSNEVPPLDTSILLVILVSELTPYLRGCRRLSFLVSSFAHIFAPWQKRRRKWQVRKKRCSCEFLNNVQSQFLVNNIYFLSLLLLTMWCYFQEGILTNERSSCHLECKL
jgi:hypothetical protein